MNGWRTKADVLKDLGEVNGRRTGAEHLDQHVVAGERPPPIHHETPDAEEMNYLFDGSGASAVDNSGPDLNGISVMLKMVNEMDETVDHHEPITVYRNQVTDEIRISKLNPCAGEYVPVSTRHTTLKPQFKQEPTNRDDSRKTTEDIIITSSPDSSLHMKRQKNVAIATLLKMGMAPDVEPVHLMTPDYYKNPPSKDEEVKTVKKEGPISEQVDYNVDRDSVNKVNGWFNSLECPKPKQPPLAPLTLKETASSITFKKKTSDSRLSVTSPYSDLSSEKEKESPKKNELKSFKPSSYASDLLQRYERNARAPPPREDLGSRLERQLRARDHLLQQKLAHTAG